MQDLIFSSPKLTDWCWGMKSTTLVLSLRTSRAVECVWNLMAHGDAWEEKWRGNWRMEWVASTLTLPQNVVYPALLTLMRTPRLPAFDWTYAPADLNGLVCFGKRRNLVSAHVPSSFKHTIPLCLLCAFMVWSGTVLFYFLPSPR